MELFLRRNSATSSRLRKHYDFQSLRSHVVSQIHKSTSRVTSVTSFFILLHSFDRFSEIVDGSEMVKFTWKLNIISVIALRETNFDRIQLNRLFLRNWRVTRVSEYNEFYVYEKRSRSIWVQSSLPCYSSMLWQKVNDKAYNMYEKIMGRAIEANWRLAQVFKTYTRFHDSKSLFLAVRWTSLRLGTIVNERNRY